MTGSRVEIAGGLVGQQDARTHHSGPGDRYSLPFTTGKLRGPVLGAFCQPDGLECSRDPAAALGARDSCEDHGKGDILGSTEARNEVKGLEDEADALSAKARELFFGQGPYLLPLQAVGSGTGSVEATEEIQHRGDLFFVDSYTTHESIALRLAHEAGVPAVRRDVFLDPDRAPGTLEREFSRLKMLARQRGFAVGIGHPYPETLTMLESELPKLADEGFELVSISTYIMLKNEMLRRTQEAVEAE